MSAAMKRTGAGMCQGCGELIPDNAAFCPVCGTRQVPDRRMPGDRAPVEDFETELLGRSANAWLLASVVAGALLFLAVGIVGGWIGAHLIGGDGSGDADSGAAESMDSYAPIAEQWVEKDAHVAEEASGEDPNGLATAAEDARIWIGVNSEDLRAVASGASGQSAGMYQELVGIFDQRSQVLEDIESTAAAGGTGPGAASDEMAALEGLDQRADDVTCEIAAVMRAEGDDPDDHITPEMGVDC